MANRLLRERGLIDSATEGVVKSMPQMLIVCNIGSVVANKIYNPQAPFFILPFRIEVCSVSIDNQLRLGYNPVVLERITANF